VHVLVTRAPVLQKTKIAGNNVTACIANNELDYLVRQQFHPNPRRGKSVSTATRTLWLPKGHCAMKSAQASSSSHMTWTNANMTDRHSPLFMMPHTAMPFSCCCFSVAGRGMTLRLARLNMPHPRTLRFPFLPPMLLPRSKATPLLALTSQPIPLRAIHCSQRTSCFPCFPSTPARTLAWRR